MEFAYSAEVEALQERLRAFMAGHVLPADPAFRAAAAEQRHAVEILEPLKVLAREAGLWNLFLPALRDDEPGTRLSNLAYAPLAEIMGRVPWSAEVFNCSAPDTGNIELLHRFATPAQREWLLASDTRDPLSVKVPPVA